MSVSFNDNFIEWPVLEFRQVVITFCMSPEIISRWHIEFLARALRMEQREVFHLYEEEVR